MRTKPFQTGKVYVRTKLTPTSPCVTREFDSKHAANAYVIRWAKRNLPTKDPVDIAERLQSVCTVFVGQSVIKWIERLPWGLTAY